MFAEHFLVFLKPLPLRFLGVVPFVCPPLLKSRREKKLLWGQRQLTLGEVSAFASAVWPSPWPSGSM